MGRIVLANHKGDEVIATFDPRNAESLQVAQARLTRFLEDCVKQFGTKPPVWARRCGQTQFEPFQGDLTQAEEVLLQPPLVGG